jgi:hypothetical protein
VLADDAVLLGLSDDDRWEHMDNSFDLGLSLEPSRVLAEPSHGGIVALSLGQILNLQRLTRHHTYIVFAKVVLRDMVETMEDTLPYVIQGVKKEGRGKLMPP